MAKTVVGLVETPQEAQSVVRDLTSKGFPSERIGLMASERQSAQGASKGRSKKSVRQEARQEEDAASGALAGAGTGAALGGVAGLALALVPLAIPGIGPIVAAGPIAAALAGAGIGAVAGGLIGGLTKLGVPEDEAHYYAEGVRRGGTLITVSAETDAQADDAVEILKRHGAVDIDERAASWRSQGWSGRFEEEDRAGAAANDAGERSIPVVEEELVVGKREAAKGAVRVYSHVVEQPVEESVNLREERASVERRPVDREVEAGDAGVFREQTIEVKESAEEPVVGKRARVVEEVSVGKQQTERQQKVRETLRKTEVEVERSGGNGAWTGSERRARAAGPYSGVERRRAA